MSRYEPRKHDIKKISAKKKAKKDKKPHLSVIKVRALMVLFFGILIFLSFMILYIKLTHGDDFERRAILQLIQKGSGSEQAIAPNRGTIVDRNGEKALALSTKTYSVFLDAQVLVTLSDEVQANSVALLNKKLGIPEDELWVYLEVDKTYDEDGKLEQINFKNPKNDSPYIVLRRDIPRIIAKEIESANARCVYIEEGSKRNYPEGTVAAHIIGFTRGDAIWGLEQVYDTELTGKDGRIYRDFTDSGNITPKRVEPVDGYTLVTTIDYQIQQASEELVIKYGEYYDAKNATIIVIDPNTGEVLANAVYPSFDLNAPASVSNITKSEYRSNWADLSSSEQLNNIMGVWKNYSISSTIEPGSIFKPFVIAMALEEGIITPEDRFYCSGYKSVGGYDIHCHKKTGHGSLSLIDVVAQSCNVAMMDIAEEMGREIFLSYQHDFGFGEKTGIDLPGEANAASLLFTLSELNSTQLATSSFGQRFNATPIQLIDAYTALINGGNLMKPYVVSRVLDSKNNLVFENLPTINRKVISQETSDFIRKAMLEVMKPTGTGRGAYIEGYEIGGKTGTAEQGIKDTPNYHYAVSIVGFLPVDDPKYLAIALIDHPAEYADGVTTASPMIKELFQSIIDSKNIERGSNADADKLLQTQSDLVELPDFIGMSAAEATRQLNRLGLDYDFIGSQGSVIMNQHPQAGKLASKSAIVLLTIGGDTESLKSVPDVEGMELEEAKEYITKSGLVPVVFYDEQLSSESPVTTNDGEASSQPQSKYTVYQQAPKKNMKLPEGTEIKIKAKPVDES